MSDMTEPPAPQSGRKLPSDAELLAQIGQGDQTAFDGLVNRHARYLYGVAHSLCGNTADADDLVQETLVAALNGLKKFRGESSVRTWLVAILVRQAAMLRRKKRPEALPVVFDAGNQSGTEARLDLSIMLQSLSPEHRQVIVLRELEHMSYEQMAAALDIPRGTVESRLFRAREELRKRFKGYMT